MKKSTYVLLFVISLITVLQFCSRKVSPIAEDPIATIGHGSFLNKEGKEIKLTETFIKQVQELYIRKLSAGDLAVREGGTFNEQKIKTIKELIYSNVDNDILANALFVEWLIEQRKPRDEAQYSNVNNALRWYYVLKIQKNPILPDKTKKWTKGIPETIARKLKDYGVVAYAITNSGMQAYCQECLEAGVPVPPNMFGPEWKRLGSFDNEFISGGLQAELMIYVSNEPEGFCLALPRYNGSGSSVENEAQLFGVICLGTRSSKACFFDNPRGNFFRRDEVIDFRSNFLGGTDLIVNAQGICTDCHAGENPYIIHPEKKPFMAIYDHVLSTLPPRWHGPIVPGTWPQNPGPTNILYAVSSAGQCISCHQQGSAGRFPDLSFPLQGYCTAVLSNAVRPISSGGTMPPNGLNRALFEPHINALQSYCSLSPADGKIETAVIPPDPTFISPPIVIGPVYTCVTRVAVRGAVLDAKVTLFINGAPVSAISPARNPLQLDFNGLSAMRAGDVVTATQEKDGAVSAPSAGVTVRNYQEDYPGGLPKPSIDPNIIFECANLIAIKHVPGADLTVFTNGANPVTFGGGGTGWTAVSPTISPFTQANEFTVQISICGDLSPMSDPVRVKAAPAVLANPAFNPPDIFNGQELLNIESIVYGAKVTLRETVSGWSGSFSTPITWYPNYDIKTAMGRPINGSDRIEKMQILCNVKSEWTPPGRVFDCERLPAPQIERPVAANNFVIVASAVPGARVMIYDGSGAEIGDGTGPVVMLRRSIIAGEILTVAQRVGECTSRFVYRVRASGK